MNKLLNGLKENANVKYTENGAIARSTTGHSLYDMFAFGGAYRSRSEEDYLEKIVSFCLRTLLKKILNMRLNACST